MISTALAGTIEIVMPVLPNGSVLASLSICPETPGERSQMPHMGVMASPSAERLSEKSTIFACGELRIEARFEEHSAGEHVRDRSYSSTYELYCMSFLGLPKWLHLTVIRKVTPQPSCRKRSSPVALPLETWTGRATWASPAPRPPSHRRNLRV